MIDLVNEECAGRKGLLKVAGPFGDLRFGLMACGGQFRLLALDFREVEL